MIAVDGRGRGRERAPRNGRAGAGTAALGGRRAGVSPSSCALKHAWETPGAILLTVRRRCLVCDFLEERVEPEDTDLIGPPCTRCHAPSERIEVLPGAPVPTSPIPTPPPSAASAASKADRRAPRRSAPAAAAPSPRPRPGALGQDGRVHRSRAGEPRDPRLTLATRESATAR